MTSDGGGGGGGGVLVVVSNTDVGGRSSADPTQNIIMTSLLKTSLIQDLYSCLYTNLDPVEARC